MPDICLYVQVHQPHRLRRFRVFDIGTGKGYFDDELNASILRKVADKCYLPATRLLLDLVRESAGQFRVGLSLSGVLLEQLARTVPDALAAFQQLAGSGGAELLGETYEHSLAGVTDRSEFVSQVERHRDAVGRWFGQRPSVFRNTELIYSDALAPLVASLGFRAVLVEGADGVLRWRSPNYVYEAASAPGLRLLPRNYRLSDDVGFRFSNRAWSGWPLTAARFADWVAKSPGECVNLFLDYETFGEHQWAETGIFDFVRHLPREAERRGLRFVLPSELAGRAPSGTLSFPHATSWADAERDLSAWLGNRMQQAAHERLYRLRREVVAANDEALLSDWRRLTTSDHFYYICTKWFSDGDVHKYFNPYETPYDAFIALANVLQDLEQRCAAARAARRATRRGRRPLAASGVAPAWNPFARPRVLAARTPRTSSRVADA